MLNQFILNVKRQETPFYSNLYKIAKQLRKVSCPTIYPIHKPLYTASRILINFRWKLQESLWSIPLFRTQCRHVGSGIRLPNGIPWITGNNIEIEIGDNVSIAKSHFATGKVNDKPILKIGNDSSIGYETTISVNEKVEIGNGVMIAFGCFIADSDGHPVESARRHESITKNEVSPVKICNNVWIGSNATVLKGVTIGKNSIVGANSVVVKDIPPNKICMGIPARVVGFIK
jgi:acetyltransferase-like isoleucine patch superfamily enzyme